MNRAILATAFFLLMTYSRAADASYPGVPWGTTLGQLEKTFPGIRRSPNPGVPTYLIDDLHVAGHLAYALFSVSPDQGVIGVDVHFYESKDPAGNWQSGTPAEQEKLRQALDIWLTKTRGPRVFGVGIWDDSDGCVMLFARLREGLSLGYSPDAPASRAIRVGYADTRWGETLDAVRKSYPGGWLQPDQNGGTSYRVVRVVSARENAVIIFDFASQKGLARVTIDFPKVGTTADLKRGPERGQEHALFFTPETETEAVETFRSMKDRLETKYGKPSKEVARSALWGMGEVDIGMPGDATGTFVAISYTPTGTPDETASGL